jgi:hypothetical protein
MSAAAPPPRARALSRFAAQRQKRPAARPLGRPPAPSAGCPPSARGRSRTPGSAAPAPGAREPPPMAAAWAAEQSVFAVPGRSERRDDADDLQRFHRTTISLPESPEHRAVTSAARSHTVALKSMTLPDRHADAPRYSWGKVCRRLQNNRCAFYRLDRTRVGLGRGAATDS